MKNRFFRIFCFEYCSHNICVVSKTYINPFGISSQSALQVNRRKSVFSSAMFFLRYVFFKFFVSWFISKNMNGSRILRFFLSTILFLLFTVTNKLFAQTISSTNGPFVSVSQPVQGFFNASGTCDRTTSAYWTNNPSCLWDGVVSNPPNDHTSWIPC